MYADSIPQDLFKYETEQARLELEEERRDRWIEIESKREAERIKSDHCEMVSVLKDVVVDYKFYQALVDLMDEKEDHITQLITAGNYSHVVIEFKKQVENRIKEMATILTERKADAIDFS